MNDNNFDDIFDLFDNESNTDDPFEIQDDVEETSNIDVNFDKRVNAKNTSQPQDILTQVTVTDTIYKPFIPSQDGGYVETETINIPGQQPITVQYKVPAKPKLAHEVEMWDAINEFENKSWSPKNMGLKTGWNSIDNAFAGGLKSGFIVVAGDSNIGKSGFMSQLAWQVAENNPGAYVLDFSLDDPMPDKLARVVGAGSKVLLNAVKNPGNYHELPTMLVRRKEALNKLRGNVDRYKAYDANFTTFVEEIEEEVKRIKIALDAEGIDKQICVFIDNLHDLNIRDNPNLQDKNKFDFIAQWAADLAIKYDIPVVCTAELKKLNSTRRPVLDDIRECVKIKYEAKAVLMVYNEVHYKGESADVYFLRGNNPLKQPVFEVHFAKNKIHSFKGRCFFEFFPEMARLEESDAQVTKTYSSLIFGS